jgi:hypothetical protein
VRLPAVDGEVEQREHPVRRYSPGAAPGRGSVTATVSGTYSERAAQTISCGYRRKRQKRW